MQEYGAISRSQNSMKQVYQLYQNLMNTIHQMDQKIEEVIEQHTAEFLLAYRNHIKTMKQELTAMKDRAEQQEKKMLSNDRGIFLQKQLILFREEALKLYDKLQQKTHQNQINKSHLKEMQRAIKISEKENKQLLRSLKSLEASLSSTQIKLEEISRNNQILQLELNKYKNHEKQYYLTKGQTSHTDQQVPNQNQNQIATSHLKQSKVRLSMLVNNKFQVKSRERRTSSRGIPNKLSFITQSRKQSSSWMDHELKNCFLECLQTIRREVAQRRPYGAKTEDISSIHNWNQFLMIDKLRLLEMFMQNEKLLVWMYQKIFPSRMHQIQAYLTNKGPNHFENGQKSKSMNFQFQSMGLVELDKVDPSSIQSIPAKIQKTKPRSKKYDVLGRIQMRNGKLNLSQVQAGVI